MKWAGGSFLQSDPQRLRPPSARVKTTEEENASGDGGEHELHRVPVRSFAIPASSSRRETAPTACSTILPSAST